MSALVVPTRSRRAPRALFGFGDVGEHGLADALALVGFRDRDVPQLACSGAVLVVDVVEHEDDAAASVDGVHGAVVDRGLEPRLGVFGEADEGDQRGRSGPGGTSVHTHVR